ncbi:condensation domain-containing protein [Streptomyces sp. NPDC058295]|uniref:condensation domain-containing protein n=1 Tax=Streptomyces sp. NPDC058295 TaxID=3346431 RepID=UPI0036E1CC84
MTTHETAHTTDARDIVFRGLDSARGPSTWGQRQIWASYLDNRGNPARFVLVRAWPVPGGTGIPDVLSALGGLVERHTALRTRLLAGDNAPRQVVDGDGVVPCRVTESRALWTRTAAVEAARWSGADGFLPDAEPPVRFEVLTCGAVPQWVTMAVSHMVADADSCAVLERDFQSLLRERPLTPGVCQPLDRARFEQSDVGRAQHRRAVAYWEKTLDDHPDPLFPSRDLPYLGPRYPVVQATVHGLGDHVERISRGLRLSASAVCVAAFSLAFSACAETDRHTLGVTFSNRVQPWSHGYVGTLAQHGVIGVSGSDSRLDRAARHIWTSLLHGHRYACYETSDVLALIGRRYGQENSDWFGPVANFVNFQYLPTDDKPLPHPGSGTTRPGPAGTRDRAADHRPVFAEQPPQQDSAVRFGLHIGSDRTDLSVRMSFDQTCIPLDRVHEIVERAASTLWSSGA